MFLDKNCVAQNNLGVCMGCKEGLLPYKGRCVYYDPYCLEYDYNGLYCVRTFGGAVAVGYTGSASASGSAGGAGSSSGSAAGGGSAAAGGAAASGGSAGSGSGSGAAFGSGAGNGGGAGFSIMIMSLQHQLTYKTFVRQAQAASSTPLSSDYIGGSSQGSHSSSGQIYWLPFAGISSLSI